jgi:hypothetical protein
MVNKKFTEKWGLKFSGAGLRVVAQKIQKSSLEQTYLDIRAALLFCPLTVQMAMYLC